MGALFASRKAGAANGHVAVRAHRMELMFRNELEWMWHAACKRAVNGERKVSSWARVVSANTST